MYERKLFMGNSKLNAWMKLKGLNWVQYTLFTVILFK
uniref:Uncharacterized protein n=1 Tax=Anguilla anguilla TaxID=7936 RepID=A0A0E9SU91_ANGAN